MITKNDDLFDAVETTRLNFYGNKIYQFRWRDKETLKFSSHCSYTNFNFSPV